MDYLVLPQIAGARKSLSLLARVNVAFILAGLALEVASIIAYGMLTQAVLPRKSRPRLFTTIRIELSTLSVSHLVPGGSAAASALGFRLLGQQGVSGSDAGFALAIQGIGSAVVLNVLLWLALVVSIPTHGFNPLYGTAAAAGAVVIGGFGLSVLALTKGEERAARSMRFVARHAPFLDEDKMDALIHRLAARLVMLLADRRLLLSAVGWAAANWLLDAASLEVFVWAFGRRPGVVGLLVSYGLANVLAAIPITPGGLGIVEAVLTSTLVGFGTARGIAILGVISYRLVSFWLPIPVGGIAYLSLRARLAARERREELARLAKDAALAADRPTEWAERHGIRLPRSPQQRPPGADPDAVEDA
ncbi:MAG: YbhN family protein [Actinomycetota bacterium]|nr:YbhN family protein [Actinomycetota bacterium]